ncbi:hypothetical protein STPH2_1099 [Streptomyces sp. KO7888]|nr:hypothetical protein [Streptomyces sp. KO7888]
MRTFFRSPACDAVKILCRRRRTSSSTRRQSIDAQSKSSPSGPFTGADTAGRAEATPSAISMVSNLPLGSVVFIQRFCTGSPGPRQHPFGSGQCPYPDSYAGRPAESPIVCPGFPFPFGFRRWLLGPSCSRWGVEPSLRSADRAKVARTPTGFPRSTQMRYDRGGCSLYPEAAVSTWPE